MSHHRSLSVAFSSLIFASIGLMGLVAADTSASNVSLEQDLVALSSNATQYQALARVLNRYFSIISTITTQGRA